MQLNPLDDLRAVLGARSFRLMAEEAKKLKAERDEAWALSQRTGFALGKALGALSFGEPDAEKAKAILQDAVRDLQNRKQALEQSGTPR